MNSYSSCKSEDFELIRDFGARFRDFPEVKTVFCQKAVRKLLFAWSVNMREYLLLAICIIAVRAQSFSSDDANQFLMYSYSSYCSPQDIANW